MTEKLHHKLLGVVLGFLVFVAVIDPPISTGFKKVLVIKLKEVRLRVVNSTETNFRAYTSEGETFLLHPIDVQRTFLRPIDDGFEICVKQVRKLVTGRKDLKMAKRTDCAD